MTNHMRHDRTTGEEPGRGPAGNRPSSAGLGTLLLMQRRAGNTVVSRMVAQRALLGTRTDEDDLPPGHPDSLAPGATPPTEEEPAGTPPAPDFGPTIPDGEERSEDEESSGGGTSTQRLFTSAVPTTFPSFARMIASPTVQIAAHAAWLQTLATTTPTGRREQGFWITWNSRWGTFSTSPTGYGPVVGPATTASVVLPAKPADRGTTYTVGSFHTHTPTTYRTVGRAVGPSGADVAADAADNVCGVVYDFFGNGSGNLPAGRTRLWPARLYHSGNSRRV